MVTQKLNDGKLISDDDGSILHSGIFAGIHLHDGVTSQSIPTGTGYTKITQFMDNEPSSNCTPDAANDKITITKAGIYRVSGSFSFSSATANLEWFGSAFLDGVEQNNIHWTRQLGTANDVGSASFTGFIDVPSVPVDLDFRVRHDGGLSANLTIDYCNFNCEYIGKT